MFYTDRLLTECVDFSIPLGGRWYLNSRIRVMPYVVLQIVVKALGKGKAKGTLAYDALKQIAAIYKIDEKDLPTALIKKNI